MIKICDAIMGSGKSSAAITYINEHPEKKFLYLSPYIDEAKRIRDACPEARFQEPSGFTSDYGPTKVAHSFELLDNGENIASTHQALLRYSPDMYQSMRQHDYMVIIDETLNILSKVNVRDKNHAWHNITGRDVEILHRAGLIYEDRPGEFKRTDEPCENCKYTSVLRAMEARSLVQISPDDAGWCWLFSKELFECAHEVIILTYLFDGSEMEQFLNINGFEYEFIGISRDDDGTYRFSEQMEYIPPYVRELKKKIHICRNRKLNSIGDIRYSFSENWFDRLQNEDDIKMFQIHQYNFFTNIAKDKSSKHRMIGTFGNNWNAVRGKGYGKAPINQVMFNQRSSNRWIDYTSLSYPVNIFLNPFVYRYYQQLGGYVSPDTYALSTMIQWIWRSAIRRGEEIDIFVPSKRMRDLLTRWVNNVSRGREVSHVAKL